MDSKSKLIAYCKENKHKYNDIEKLNEAYCEKVYELFANDVMYKPETQLDRVYIGRYYNIKRDFYNAAKYLLPCAEEGNHLAMRTLGNVYIQKGDPKTAEMYWINASKGADGYGFCELAAHYLIIDKYQEAIEYAFNALERGDELAASILGFCYCFQQNYDKGLEYLLRGSKSESSIGLFEIGLNFREQKNYKKAMVYLFAGSIFGDERCPNVLASCCMKQGEYDIAIKFFLYDFGLGNKKHLITLGNLYHDKNDFENAMKYWTDAIDIHPGPAYVNIGMCYDKDYKNHDKAIECYLLAIEYGQTSCANNLAICYKRKGDVENELKYFKLAVDNKDVMGVMNLTMYYEEMGDYEQMLKYWMVGNECDDQFFTKLAKFYMDNKWYVRVLEMFLKLHSIFMCTKGELMWIFNPIATEFNDIEKAANSWKQFGDIIDRGKVINIFNLVAVKLRFEDKDKFMDLLEQFEFNDDDKLNDTMKSYVELSKEKK
jgi:tetratricopeptide (TPR) repeat protein